MRYASKLNQAMQVQQRSKTARRYYATLLSVIAAAATLQSGAPAAFDVEAGDLNFLLDKKFRLDSAYMSGAISRRKYCRYMAELNAALANAQQAPPPNSGMDMNTMAMMLMLQKEQEKKKHDETSANKSDKDDENRRLAATMLMMNNGNYGGPNNYMALMPFLI